MRWIALGTAVAVTYVATARIGFQLAYAAEQVTTVWAPTGIALAALLLWGIELWPFIWVAALAANAGSDAPLWSAAGIATGNTLEALAGTWALHRVPGFAVTLRRVADAVAFVLVAAVLSTPISATVGVATLCVAAAQPWERFTALWFDWWLGDALGALIVAPAVLTTFGHRWTRRAWTDAALYVAGAVLVTHLVYAQPLGISPHPLAYVVFPIAIAAAVSGGPPVTSLVVLAASVVTIADTVGGAGPFAGPEVHRSLILLQVFMGVLAATSLLLAAAIAERRASELREKDAATTLRQRERARIDAEIALREANRELGRRVLEQQTLLDVLPIGIGIATDPECRHIRTNRAFAATLGLAPDANASKTAPAAERPTNFRVLTADGEEVPDDQLPMQVAAREGREVRDVELDVVHEDGRIVHLLEYAAPLLDESGVPCGAVGAFVDVSAAHASQAVNARLYQEAEQANRLKDEFLATLSHELRTPLNAVLGWTHMLRDGRLPPDMHQRALESLERNARAQAQLVDDLLDVSRITAGKLQIHADAVDLAPVIANAVETVRASALAKRVELEVHLPPHLRIFVTGDAGRVQQIVWNLVANAIKFTPAGGRVDVELQQVESRAEITVRDTGQGIAPSFQPHLFQRFRQMDAAKTRLHGGLGLGLSIVRHLTEAHGGTVTAESEGEGRGATFRVSLPIRAVTDTGHLTPTPVDAATAVALANVRAMIVEDDGDSRESVRVLLESRGAHVVTAGSVGEALHLLAQDPFDVLIADIGMSEQDGLALIRVIRSQPAQSANQSIPAIAVTACAPGGRGGEEALAAGFDRHVGKPADPDQLVAAISSLRRA